MIHAGLSLACPRKRYTSGQQGLRDREAPQKDRGARAREPRGQGARCRGPQQAMGGRHHLHRDGRRTALPRSRDRRVPQEGRGLVDVRAQTEKLVADALGQAVGRGSPPGDFSLVFRDDQGTQHVSRAFQRCLESHGIAQSMSRPGNPWDDALAESFFKTPERELASGKGCKTRGGGEAGRVRIHRALLQQAEDALIDRL